MATQAIPGNLAADPGMRLRRGVGAVKAPMV